MGDDVRRPPGGPGAGDERYAPGGNPADPDEHRHGGVVHTHRHTGPHEHGDDLEYDEAHDPDMQPRRTPGTS